MKKVLSLLLAIIMVFSVETVAFAQEEDMNSFVIEPSIIDMTKTRPRSDIYLRDPFILSYGGYYFMYGTGAAQGLGYGCYVSEDLENWAGPVNVFTATADFDGDKDFWAPECHYYNGMFYLFASYHSKTTGFRGTSVFRSESPLGPFTEISDGHATPHTYDAIDGTLYVDPDGQPWMVYCREWTATEDGIGRMTIAKLSDDLSRFISEPQDIFRADDPLGVTGQNVTDGPFLYTTNKGKLLMIWSSCDVGYCVKIAQSLNGKVDGKWVQQPEKLYTREDHPSGEDGGHGMIFTDKDGRLLVCFHSPNGGDTRVDIYEVVDTGDTLMIKEKYEERSKIKTIIDNVVAFFTNIWIASVRLVKQIFDLFK